MPLCFASLLQVNYVVQEAIVVIKVGKDRLHYFNISELCQ